LGANAVTADIVVSEAQKIREWLVARLPISQVFSTRSLDSELLRGSGKAMMLKMAGAGVAFAAQAVVARILGPEYYGAYIYVVNWLLLLAILGKLGLDTGALRFVASYVEMQDWAALRGFLWRATAVTLGSSIALGAAAALVVRAVSPKLASGLPGVFLVGCAILPALTLLDVTRSALRGLKSVAGYLAPAEIIRPLAFIGGATAIFVLERGHLEAEGAMAAYGAATLVALVIAFGWLLRSLPAQVRCSSPSYATRKWIRVSLPLLLISGLYLVMNRADTLMVGSLVSTTDAGVYATASRVATLALFGLTASNAIAAPMIAQHYHGGRMDDLRHLLRRASRLSFGFFSVAGCILAAAGPFVLGLFGPSFREGYVVLLILLGAQAANAFVGPVGFVMTMTGKQDTAAGILALGALTNVGLNFMLIPMWGKEGAAIATATSILLWNIAMAVYVSRTLGVRTTPI